MAKLQTQSELDDIVRRYRKRIGIDPVCLISLSIVSDRQVPRALKKSNATAWIEPDLNHPIYYIKIRSSYLRANKKYPRHIIRCIVHELFHILIGDAFERLKPSYDYKNRSDARIEEALVMKLARALVPIGDEELYEVT